MLKHVRGGDLEGVVWMKTVQSILIRIRKPDFLEEDYLGFGVAKKVREIMTVPLEAFNIKR